ncbi:FGGY carbohydrate kinase domain-containing protein [Dermatophagoides pteronyssinus]|uniref:FGGY carbohydrate kinase domain-containing protein n=1 Tax=Dermatophagoides pteronyssinus TaxID=6956 RepID=UPI003F67BAAC
MLTLCCDVGSGSVRVAIFEFNNYHLNSKPLAVSTHPLIIYNRKKNFYEQKSSEIWQAFCMAARDCCKQIKLNRIPLVIDSIGFTATCSLVIITDDHDNRGESSNDYDVIMWMDHRALKEAELINQTGHQILEQFGGTCSPEFSLSKLIWIYNNESERFRRTKALMELPDWLSYRCSNQWSKNQPELFPRSLCSVVCKWGFDAENNKWRSDFFEKLGIKFDESIRMKIGNKIIQPGMIIGYLSAEIAQQIGISMNDGDQPIKITCPLIDAHAGALSMLTFSNSSISKSNLGETFENVLCMIAGTSTCHMILNQNRTMTKGIWGPYRNAIIPGYYLREAGQSASGVLVEHIIRQHKSSDEKDFKEIIEKLNNDLRAKNFIYQTSLVMNPSYHGNRSPIADSRLKGAIYGMTLEDESLLEIYCATIEAIAYETKFIVEEIERNERLISQVIVSGGLTKNEFYLQKHADILERKIFVYDLDGADHMLTGTAIMAFVAAINHSNSLEELISLLNQVRTDIVDKKKIRIFEPRSEILDYHRKRYKCYRRLLECSIEIETIMSS